MHAGGLERATNGDDDREGARRIAVQTQRVGVDRDARPVAGNGVAIANDRHRLPGCSLRVIEHGVRIGARHKAAVGKIRAIGKRLGSHRQSRLTTRVEERRSRKADEGERRRGVFDGCRDRAGKIQIASGLIVERPVRLHVSHGHMLQVRDREERRHLIGHHRTDDVVWQRQSLAPEALSIDIAGMRAHGNAMAAGRTNRAGHGLAVACVAATGDVDRGQMGDEGKLRLERRFGGRLADVSVQIDAQARVFLPRREDVWRKKEKGTT
jgi:hypothetical protein